MVPVQVGALEHDVGDDAEDGQRDALLDDLQLDEVEGTAVLDKAYAVGRYLTAVLIYCKRFAHVKFSLYICSAIHY